VAALAHPGGAAGAAAAGAAAARGEAQSGPAAAAASGAAQGGAVRPWQDGGQGGDRSNELTYEYL